MMNMIYYGSDAQNLRKILDRKDIYLTLSVTENGWVYLNLKQKHKDGTETFEGSARFHVPEEEK